jgi:hypothetical protein
MEYLRCKSPQKNGWGGICAETGKRAESVLQFLLPLLLFQGTNKNNANRHIERGMTMSEQQNNSDSMLTYAKTLQRY